LAIKPAIVLLDEPFSALDAELRGDLRSDVIQLLRSQNTTAILVTHDREEALVSADIVALMRDGQIVQQGTPEQVYSLPISPSIAISTGDALVLDAAQSADGSTHYLFNKGASAKMDGVKGEIVIRPEEIKISREITPQSISGEISKIDYYGHDAMISIGIEGQVVVVRIPGPFDYEVGDQVSLEHVGPVRFFASSAQ
jgi:iron(III) transport system ATP-binding protein